MTTQTAIRPASRPFADGLAAVPRRFACPNGAPRRMRVHIATNGREPGNWLISVDNERCGVFEGSVPSPDARLYTDSDIGAGILQGRVALDEAISAGLLDWDGDREVLYSLAACLGLGGSL
jgi:hypothetical protein